MTAFQQADLDIVGDPNFGETVTYSRTSGEPVISALPVRVSVKTGGEYASPTGPIGGSVFVPQAVNAIPGGPQKGDVMVIPSLNNRAFFVQEIFLDPKIGWAALKIRLVPA